MLSIALMAGEKQYNGAKNLFQQMVAKQLVICISKQKEGQAPKQAPSGAINLKMIVGLHIKHKAIELLEDNIRQNLDNFGVW